MSLTLVKAFDLQAYSQAVLAAGGHSTLGTIYGTFSQSSAGEGGMVYLHSRDALYTTGRRAASPTRGLLFRLDPELEIVTGRALAYVDSGVDFYAGLVTGQFNPATGVQKLYVRLSSTTLEELNPDTLQPSGSAAYTGPNGDFHTDFAVGIGSGEGHWSTASAGLLRGAFFEHLTDGIPGETVLVGSNVYPKGLYWAPCSSGTLNATTRVDIWGWIDVHTTRLTGRPGGLTPTAFPRVTVATPSGLQDQSEAPIAGDAFSWVLAGFTLDPDATAAQPKGELFFHCAGPIGASGTPPPGQIARAYVRWSDFNPFNLASAAGVPTRTHGRIRLTSRLLLPLNPQFNIPGQEYWSGASSPIFVAYDPVRRRCAVTMHREEAISGGTTAAKHAIGFYSRAVDPVIVTAPAPRSVPRTADVVAYESFVGGDLGEPAAGQLVTFSLARRSTEGEVVTITGGVGTTSTLAHPAVDTDAAGTPELTLTADGTPLALTTNYTVVAATGVITWVTSQVGKLVLATYNHRNTDALPAHGTLLAEQVQADENGTVRTEIEYPDNDALVGTIDALTSTLG